MKRSVRIAAKYRPTYLKGGPFSGKTIPLSMDATTCVFALGDHIGRYRNGMWEAI